MPTPRKPKGKPGKNASMSALDSEKRLLQERQRQLDEKIAALNHTIRDYHLIPGRTIPANPATSQPPAGKRQVERRRPREKVVLRAEKQEGRLQTFALVLVVIALILWAVYRYL